MSGPLHLVRRFFGSLVPAGEPRADREWILENLIEGEQDIWRTMSRPDRRHAAGVARRVERALGNEAGRPVIAAALLHDCGKTVSGLGTYGRVIATLSVKLAGHEQALAWRELSAIQVMALRRRWLQAQRKATLRVLPDW